MKQFTAREVEQKLKKGEQLNIIDVRETFEVARGKIPSAINIPLRLIESKLPDLDKRKEYIIVCHSGGRSFQATRFLERYGFKVINMSDGMLSWEGKVE